VIRKLGRMLALAAVALVALPVASALAEDADTFDVNQPADAADVLPGDNICDADPAAGPPECTLRAAMQEQEDGDTTSTDTINFTLSAGTTLELASSLATLPVDENLIVDGCSEVISPSAPCVGVRNSNALGQQTIFQIDGGTVTIRGLALTNASTAVNATTGTGFTLRNSYFGIKLDGTTADAHATGATISVDNAAIGGPTAGTRNVFGNNAVAGLRAVEGDGISIEGNFFGVRPDGTTAAPNADDIRLEGTVAEPNTNTTVGGTLLGTACTGPCNVIANATSEGIDLNGTTDSVQTTTINGNYIGLDVNGAAAADNTGIRVTEGVDTRIGGPAVGDRNYIDAVTEGINSQFGAPNLDIQNNFLGLTTDGNTDIWPAGAGLGNAIGLNVVSPAADGATISDNRIAVHPTHGRTGLFLGGQNAQVTGNIIGIAVNGGQLFGGDDGIEVSSASDPSGGHLIAGNTMGNNNTVGIALVGSDGNRVTGNFIGTTSGGGSHPIDAAGIRIRSNLANTSNSNVIGGTTAAAQNVISNAGFDAIQIETNGGSANEFRANVGTGNGGSFIDLGAGANAGVLPPAISHSDTGTATGTATVGATVRLFSKPSSSPGDIQAFLGQAVADASGHWKISHGAISVGKLVAATQSTPSFLPPGRSTSELSNPVATVAAPITSPPSPAAGDSDPPETAFKKKPRKKSTDRTPTFKFVSDEPGSSFQCRLDRRPFAPCGAKKTFRVRPGKHKLRVESIDTAGNIDPTPAIFKFKVL
jgi:parallel beta-helix repeat protein